MTTMTPSVKHRNAGRMRSCPAPMQDTSSYGVWINGIFIPARFIKPPEMQMKAWSCGGVRLESR